MARRHTSEAPRVEKRLWKCSVFQKVCSFAGGAPNSKNRVETRFFPWGAHRNSHVNHMISKPHKKTRDCSRVVLVCVRVYLVFRIALVVIWIFFLAVR